MSFSASTIKSVAVAQKVLTLDQLLSCQGGMSSQIKGFQLLALMSLSTLFQPMKKTSQEADCKWMQNWATIL